MNQGISYGCQCVSACVCRWLIVISQWLYCESRRLSWNGFIYILGAPKLLLLYAGIWSYVETSVVSITTKAACGRRVHCNKLQRSPRLLGGLIATLRCAERWRMLRGVRAGKVRCLNKSWILWSPVVLHGSFRGINTTRAMVKTPHIKPSSSVTRIAYNPYIIRRWGVLTTAQVLWELNLSAAGRIISEETHQTKPTNCHSDAWPEHDGHPQPGIPSSLGPLGAYKHPKLCGQGFKIPGPWSESLLPGAKYQVQRALGVNPGRDS